jgi:hypothetical protein
MGTHNTGYRPREQDTGEDARLERANDAAAVLRWAELRRKCDEDLRQY